MGVVCCSGGVVRLTDGVVVLISPSQFPNFSNDCSPGRLARMLVRLLRLFELHLKDVLASVEFFCSFTVLLPLKKLEILILSLNGVALAPVTGDGLSHNRYVTLVVHVNNRVPMVCYAPFWGSLNMSTHNTDWHIERFGKK